MQDGSGADVTVLVGPPTGPVGHGATGHQAQARRSPDALLSARWTSPQLVSQKDLK